MTEKQNRFLSYHIYQIYPRSFCDSNGDGIGDLQGVISKLDYLKDLGINAIWLCPCYKSPNEDNGYDVADYRDIMDEFGTMDDIKELIRQMHSRQMKLIMDLVPNHTSSQHKWFRESRKSRDNPYSDYYYWFDLPPNQWQSAFGGSAWQFDEQRQQYYLHSYAIGQPDLNWENPAVVEEMKEIVDFWVELGVDGFRIDVIDQISKDFEHGNNCFGPRLHEFIHALFGREKTSHLFTVGECWTNDIEEISRHIAAEREELSTLFQFDHLDAGRGEKFTRRPDSIKSVWDIMRHWEEKTQERNLLYSIFTDNHDNSWLLERVGDTGKMRYESATCLAAMAYLMRGVCFLYQGQEIGMVNPHYDQIDCFDDVESIHKYQELLETMPHRQAIEKINFGGRDNARRPMCWSGGENGGFTTGKPWIPLHSAYRELNLEKDRAAEKSVWRFYRDIFCLRRQYRALTEGRFTVVSREEDSYCAYMRSCGGEKILVVCNFEKESQIELPEACGELLLSNYGYDRKDSGVYQPYEVAVFRLS